MLEAQRAPKGQATDSHQPACKHRHTPAHSVSPGRIQRLLNSASNTTCLETRTPPPSPNSFSSALPLGLSNPKSPPEKGTRVLAPAGARPAPTHGRSHTARRRGAVPFNFVDVATKTKPGSLCMVPGLNYRGQIAASFRIVKNWK